MLLQMQQASKTQAHMGAIDFAHACMILEPCHHGMATSSTGAKCCQAVHFRLGQSSAELMWTAGQTSRAATLALSKQC